MAAPTIFRSTDAGAPNLDGNAGSLVNVLDWCLDTGTNAGALGWGIAFTAANKRAYRAPAGIRHYIDVNDAAPDGTALGRNAQVRGYEAMTAIGTGTGPFPTVAQVATCVGIVKSTATGATARPWLLIGDDRTFYFFCSPAGTVPPVLSTNTWTSAMFFGEMLSALVGDLYRSEIGYQSTTATIAVAGLGALGCVTDAAQTTVVNQSMPRSYTGAGGAVWVTMVANPSFLAAASATVDLGQFTFPNTVDGGLWLNAIDVFERTNAVTAAALTAGAQGRGRLRGLYQTPYNGTGWDDQTTFTGIGDFAGITFIALKTTNGMIAFATTAWAASS